MAVRLQAPQGRHQLKAEPKGFFMEFVQVSTAVLIDGSFFLRRFGWKFPDLNPQMPSDVAFGVILLTTQHMVSRIGPEAVRQNLAVNKLTVAETPDLYRIFFYDCPPLRKKIHLPVSKQSLDLAKTETAAFRLAVHDELRRTRKVALRLGRLNETISWKLTTDGRQRLLGNPASFRANDDDFELDVVQKGVDMRLGLDVASLAYKRQVNQIILVAADADFVPAVKLARREGIDVVVDPMGMSPANDLLEHCDGVRNERMRQPSQGTMP